jgi:hypothetical protein
MLTIILGIAAVVMFITAAVVKEPDITVLG